MSAPELAASIEESMRRPLTRLDLVEAVDRLARATEAMRRRLPSSSYGEELQGEMHNLYVATLALRRMVGLDPSPTGFTREIVL